MHSSRTRLRFASFNVHSWVGSDRRCDPERTVRVLRELDADVVALQEVRRLASDRLAHPLAEFCDEYGHKLVEGPTIARDRSSYGNAVISRVAVRSVDRADLSVGRCEARGALAVGLELGEWFCQVVATHLGLRARERRVQVAQLLEWTVTRIAQSAPDALVLAGDFNEWWPRSGVLRRLDSAFGRGSSARTFPAWRPWLRLDRIWVQPSSLVRRHLGAHDSPLARAASDHLPIVVELEVPRRVRQRSAQARSAA